MDRGFIKYKNYAINAAIELFYDKKVIEDIKAANNEAEISRILRNARKSM